MFFVFAIIYTIGITANSTALFVLFKLVKNRNSKHVLLLRCLALNDLISQLGMFTVLILKETKAIPLYWCCISYVLLRAFGLGSGCIAFLMAFERWLALTRPFLYIKLMTYKVLKSVLFYVWFTSAIITYMPLMNFGIYYNKIEDKCVRYRDAKEPKDVAYAYLFFTFGTSLCVFIILCNAGVFAELLKMRRRRKNLRITENETGKAQEYPNAEEIVFAKLMGFLCFIFVLCWLPDMLMVPWAQIKPDSKMLAKFSALGNVLKLLYFTVDPFVYVIYRNVDGKFRWCIFKKRSDRGFVKNSDGTHSSLLMETYVPNK